MRNWVYHGIALVIVLVIAFFVRSEWPVAGAYEEAGTIAADLRDFSMLSDRFSALAKEKGALYAYEVLRRAALPPQTDMHLLGHTVGDVLYEQKGTAAIADCTQEFRNACSHSIVIGALNEFGGEAALGKIRDACKAAPGGSGAYTMCYHGLGHGVFSFFSYEIPETVDFCSKTGTEPYRQREYIECVGGMVMELMGGGGHDRELWQESRKKYLTDDPLAPCSTVAVPDDVKGICYTYITPHLFERAGGDLAMPQPEHIAKAFTYCDRIPKAQAESRRSCFSGIGKELPLLAVARDTRRINIASAEELDTMRSWCRLAPHAEGYAACSQSIVDSLFWGGENDPHVSLRYCEREDESKQADCFGYLFGVASFYMPRVEAARDGYCTLAPAAYQDQCRTALKL